MIQGLLQCFPDRRYKEANNIVMHSISLGRRAIYDPICQAEHMAFYMQYDRTPEGGNTACIRLNASAW